MWRQIPALTNKHITNNDLLYIGKEIHRLDKNEEIFYFSKYLIFLITEIHFLISYIFLKSEYFKEMKKLIMRLGLYFLGSLKLFEGFFCHKKQFFFHFVEFRAAWVKDFYKVKYLPALMKI